MLVLAGLVGLLGMCADDVRGKLGLGGPLDFYIFLLISDLTVLARIARSRVSSLSGAGCFYVRRMRCKCNGCSTLSSRPATTL